MPSGPTSYSFANSTASGRSAFTRTGTVGCPVRCSGESSGAESNAAFCPGKSSDSPAPSADAWLSAPMPGSVEIPGGAPPGGLVIVFSPPASSTDREPVPPSPGYRSAVAPRSTAWKPVESTPPVLVTRNAGPVSFPRPFR